MGGGGEGGKNQGSEGWQEGADQVKQKNQRECRGWPTLPTTHHIKPPTSVHLPSVGVGPVVCTTRTRGGPPAPPPPAPWGATERSIWFSASESLSMKSGIVIIGCNTAGER